MIDVFVLFFAVLSVLSLIGAVGLGVILLGGRSGAGALGRARSTAVDEWAVYATPIAAAVATTSTLGSLFLSEIANYDPCFLCWVQRGFMYPLAVYLIVASVRGFRAAWAIPWSIVGASISILHYAEQRHWIGGSESFCDAANPCTFVWVWEFGFVSIPFMALTGFLFVIALLTLERIRSRQVQPVVQTTRSE